MLYHISALNTIVNGNLSGSADGIVQHLITDSRKLIEPKTSLFIALVGEKRDGHRYIPDLIQRGVKSFLVSQLPDQFPADVCFIQVGDTLDALQQLARYHRLRFQYPVIGLTGSNGKTIVKEWLHFLLHEEFRIIRSPRSYNSQIGVPLSIWLMDDRADLAIIEAGISQHGEMQKLEEMIQPNIGIFTNIGEAHSEGFVSKKEKIREKLKLFQRSETLIYCMDYPALDEEVHFFQQSTSIQTRTWSRSAAAEFFITENIGSSSTDIKVQYNQTETSFTIPFTDAVAIENAISCAVLLIHLNKVSLLKDRMPHLPTLAMRMEMKTGINRCTLINDSYSTDLRSLRLALEFMHQQGKREKQTVILSDIPETGIDENDLYAEVSSLLTQFNIERIIGIGPAFIRQASRWEGFDASFWVSTDAFLNHVHSASFKDQKILIKGARKFGFERIQRFLEDKHHQTLLTVNLSAIAHNLTQYRKKLSSGTRIMAMVKAFSYGSGSYEIASLLAYHHVDYLAVAYADEGVELRQAGISLPIMVMNPDMHSFDQLVSYDLQPDIFSFELLKQFSAYLQAEGISEYPVHIELDTGMHRLGFDPADAASLAIKLNQAGNVRVISVFTHLVGSDSAADDRFTEIQQSRFEQAVQVLKKGLGYTFIMHVSNTAAVQRHPHLQYDMIRLGIGLYGIDSSGMAGDLREAAALTTTIAQIHKVPKGETVGYNRRYMLQRDSIIATIRIGYADGYPIHLGNGNGSVCIKGRLFPIVGSICMDMMMIDITDDPSIHLQDEVVLFGKGFSVKELAAKAGTITYDIMTGISPRVKRVYIED